MRPDQFADQWHDARNDLVFAVVAVWKERVVGDIDIMRIRARLDDLAHDREPAKAGIKHENDRW